jgi:hypothetical protein
MNIRAYKLTRAIIVAGCLAGSLQLHAQTSFTIPFTAAQTSPATSFQIDSFGTLSEDAPLSSSATFSFTGGAPQMVWIPALGAFRAGSLNGSQTMVGQFSAAFGYSTVASANESFAVGFASEAVGLYSFAAGAGNLAIGIASTTLGSGTEVIGNYGLAAGYESSAYGYASTALGNFTSTSGYASTASGNYTTANSYASFAIGQYNTGLSSTGATPNATSWVTTDPLLEVGNGTGGSAKSDALVVYKNGNASFPATTSTVTASTFMTTIASGDIPMYNGSN